MVVPLLEFSRVAEWTGLYQRLPLTRKLSASQGSGPDALAATAPTLLSEDSPVRSPRLLVSVRSAGEAAEALLGGAAILDVKEPSMGSLGRAPPDVARSVAVLARSAPRPVRVTAARGELEEAGPPEDWTPPDGIALFKLGLSGCGARSDWRQRLGGWADRIAAGAPGGPSIEPAGGPSAGSPGLVAVAYADRELARSPEPRSVLRFAVERRLPFFLIDTFSKGAGSLRSYLEDDEIAALIVEAHAGGVGIALAGSLRLEHVVHYAALGPDVIAVRGAACREGRRALGVERGRVEGLVSALELAPTQRTPHPA
jgi:uncharacterized protein (UPF0264 family)